jgi:hypothetical protein
MDGAAVTHDIGALWPMGSPHAGNLTTSHRLVDLLSRSLATYGFVARFGRKRHVADSHPVVLLVHLYRAIICADGYSK